MHRTVMKAARCCCCCTLHEYTYMSTQHTDWALIDECYAHACANKAAASCSLHHCAMHLCVSRDVTNESPSYTAIYFAFNKIIKKYRVTCVFTAGCATLPVVI